MLVFTLHSLSFALYVIALFAECVLCLLVLVIVSVDLNIINLLYSDLLIGAIVEYTLKLSFACSPFFNVSSVCVSAMLTAQV